MDVGYLHIGKRGGGVRRYGRIIADEAGRRPDLTTTEADAGERDASRQRLRACAIELGACDVVHVQWKPADWGSGWRAFRALRSFMRASRPPVVATLHDVWERRGLRQRWLDPDAIALRWLGRRAARLIVHSEEERHRLYGFVPPGQVSVVPHFVEERVMADAEASRAALGLAGKRVITLLGFMVRRKGYRLTIEALPLLPPDVVALFAGAPISGREARADELRALAESLGVGDRVVITGYVEDARLDQALAATHVAICPFRDLSASGSLSTWISTGRPIVTSDLPQLREYDAMVPGSLRIFRPLTAAAFAEAVRATLDGGPPAVDAKVVALRERLLTPGIIEHYAELYSSVSGP